MTQYTPLCGRVTPMDLKTPCSLAAGHDSPCDQTGPTYSESKKKKKANHYFLSLGFDNTKTPSDTNQEVRINALLDDD